MVKIVRGSSGTSIKKAFEQSLDDHESLWRQTKDVFQTKEHEDHKKTFWDYLPWIRPLKCNPGVQITYHGTGFSHKKKTGHFLNPRTNDIQYDTNKHKNVLVFNLNEISKETVEPIQLINRLEQYLVIQILDLDPDNKDRIIAEALINFNAFKMTEPNYCQIEIYDSYARKESGWVRLTASFDQNTKCLTITVLEILKLMDHNYKMIKGDINVAKDVCYVLGWIIYMILTMIFFMGVEEFTFVNAIYLRFVTVFTVGYGDLYPTTDAGKLMNSLFILIDAATIGFITSKVANYILRFRELQKEKKASVRAEELNEKLKVHKKKEKKKQLQRAKTQAKLENVKLNDVDFGAASNSDEEEKYNDANVHADGGSGAKKVIHSDSDDEDAHHEEKHEHTPTPEPQKKKAESGIDKKKLKMLFSFLAVCMLIFVGTLFMYYVEEFSFTKSFEFNFVTLSTVGYGDVTPATTGGKIFCIFYIIIGVTTVVYFATAIFEVWDDYKQAKFEEAVMKRALISEAQLLEFDTDDDGLISKYEFLSKMLVETGKVEQKKIDEVMEKFDKLDDDNSGTIDLNELTILEQS